MTTDYQTFAPVTMPKRERRKLDVGDIFSNQIRCKKCNDTPRSMNRHHMAQCKCGATFVDGGSWYGRIGGDINAIEDMTVLYEDARPKLTTNDLMARHKAWKDAKGINKMNQGKTRSYKRS